MLQMPPLYEITLHHSGVMDFRGAEPEYVGGTTNTIYLDDDNMCYWELKEVATGFVEYKIVEGIWYLEPNKTMGEGLHEVRTDEDVLNGLVKAIGTDLKLAIYMQGISVFEFGADNEEGTIGGPRREEHNSANENSVVAEFSHLVDVDIHTTDDEFEDALYTIGVRRTRRRVEYMAYSSDDETEQDSVAATDSAHIEGSHQRQASQQVHHDSAHVQSPHQPEEHINEGALNHMDATHSASDADSESSYRGSENSAHIRGNISDDEGVVGIYDGAPNYDPSCANLIWLRSGKLRCEAICKDANCNFRIYGSWYQGNKSFMVRGLGSAHTCPRSSSINQATAKWIAVDFLERFRINRDWDVGQIVAEVRLRYGIEVTTRHCYRAKKKAEDMLNGGLKDEYRKLRSYVAELKRADPYGRFMLEVEPHPYGEAVYFKRFYVGFTSLREGFLAGCRKMFGLDGCFLKGEVDGMLLAAVGKDGNNQVYPIAWAVVESENRDSWSWFIQALVEDLGIVDGRGWTVISDQQKGLVASLNSIMPYAEHRKCARHVYANWRLKHSSDMLREVFWDAVYSSNEADWGRRMQVLEILENDETGTKKPYQDFLKQDPKTFCRAFMSTVPKCDSVESNICETFNSIILKCRGRRIIDMLEEIRLYAMKRVVKKQKLFTRCIDVICPRIRTIIENAKIRARNCITFATLNMVCEVKEYGDGYVVDMRNNTCSCGYFLLSGIPCTHAVVAIAFMRLNLEDHVDKVYRTEHVRKAYGYGVPALVGRQAWPSAVGYDVLPPQAKKMPGRPKKARRKEPAELQGRQRRTGVGFQLSRRGMLMHCRNCRGEGHNTRSCPALETNGEQEPQTPHTMGDEPEGSRNVRPRTEAPTRQDVTPTVDVEPINPLNEADQPPRRKKKCKTCGFSGHNSRTCPSKSGVQPMTMAVQTRNRTIRNRRGIQEIGHIPTQYLQNRCSRRQEQVESDFLQSLQSRRSSPPIPSWFSPTTTAIASSNDDHHHSAPPIPSQMASSNNDHRYSRRAPSLMELQISHRCAAAPLMELQICRVVGPLMELQIHRRRRALSLLMEL
ncbi:hypothetical protein LINPERHAP1_LOCUS38969 [Linum perenne]